MSYKTKFHRDGTVTVWSVYSQQWARISAVAAFRDDRLMASLNDLERRRIARMAAWRGHKPAAYWWYANAASAADKRAALRYQR